MKRERVESIVLLLTIGLVAAFVVSAVAGLLQREPVTRAVAPADGGVPLPRLDPGQRVRVEVLNGSGKSGLAAQATDVLRDAGFDVVQIGNAGGARRDSTVVLDRVGREGDARAVARALGVGKVTTARDASLYLEVTVILGTDWPPTATEANGGR